MAFAIVSFGIMAQISLRAGALIYWWLNNQQDVQILLVSVFSTF
jgi:hypothetical protein